MLIFGFILLPFIFEFIVAFIFGATKFSNIGFVILKAFILCIPFLIFQAERFRRILFYILYVMLFIPVIMNIIHLLIFHVELNYFSLISIFDTNLSESMEFVEHFGRMKISYIEILGLIFIAILISCLFFIERVSKDIRYCELRERYKIILCIIFVGGTYVFSTANFVNQFPFSKIITSYLHYRRDIINERAILQSRKKDFSYGGKVSSVFPDDEDETYIIVIGESVDRKHMSLYGYDKKTTPYFDSMRDELTIFKNVRSSHCHTLPALRGVLTFDEDFSKGDIVSFCKFAGFKTYWLSNQYIGGPCDNLMSIIGHMAHQSVFINRVLYSGCQTGEYDSRVLPYLKDILKDKSNRKKIVFIHLIGSHLPYKRRYPKSFEVFKSKFQTKHSREVSEYDNSILFTDFILQSIISELHNISGVRAMIYFSDHGDDVYEDPNSIHAHMESIGTCHMFEIPCIAWFSKEYKKYRQEFIDGINPEKSYQTGKMIYSLIDFLGLNHSIQNLENSLFR